MKSRKITIPVLASKIRRAPSFTRNVVNGYVPTKDAEAILGGICVALGMSMKELLIEDTTKTA